MRKFLSGRLWIRLCSINYLWCQEGISSKTKETPVELICHLQRPFGGPYFTGLPLQSTPVWRQKVKSRWPFISPVGPQVLLRWPSTLRAALELGIPSAEGREQNSVLAKFFPELLIMCIEASSWHFYLHCYQTSPMQHLENRTLDAPAQL